MKLFEILTTSVGESYVRSYAWCETAQQAVEMFDAAKTGYQIAEVTELFDALRGPFISRPSDSGFAYTQANYTA